MRILITNVLLALSFSLLAQNVHYWTGGTGDWTDAQNWDTNQVPQSGDFVYIDGNNAIVTIPNGYTARLGYLNVGYNRQLRVHGTLQIRSKSSTAFSNSGNVANEGIIAIHSNDTGNGTAYSAALSSSLTNGGNAEIHVTDFNSGLRINASTFVNEGEIYISNVKSNGIDLNSFNAEFRNERGFIMITDVENGIVVSSGHFINAGEINIPYGVTNNAIDVLDDFDNTTDGEIYISQVHNYGIKANGYADVANSGYIDIRHSGGMHFYAASLENFAGATITMSNLTSAHALLLVGNGESVHNWGTIRASGQSSVGIAVNGGSLFVNEAGSLLDIQGSGNGGMSVNASYFYNYGVIRTGSQIGPNGISVTGNNGTFYNNPCGRIDLNGGRVAVLTSSARFQNDAWLFLKDAGANHLNNGTFINAGATADRYGTLAGLNMANSGVITDPLPGPVTAGQAIFNALTYGNSSNITNITWHTSRFGPSAGSYNLSTNTYTPNSAAVGDPELWVRVYRSGCGSRWFRIPVSSSSPLQASHPVSQTTSLPQAPLASSAENWTVYPNPAVGDLYLTYPGTTSQNLQLEIWSAVGQLLWRQSFLAEAGSPLLIPRPHSAKAGHYQVRITGMEMEPVVRNLVWQ